jgi:tetratricopeptide (TPR) repeat protein
MDRLLSCREDLAVSGVLSQLANAPVASRMWARKGVVFVLAASLLVGFAGSGWLLLLSSAMASGPEADAFNTVAADIDKSVTELGYPQEVAQDLAQLAGDWKCEVWQQAISRARQAYRQKQTSPADVAQVEEAVIQGLCQTIGREIAPCREEESLKYFYLAKVLKDKKAESLGYAQLVYILGNSLGLRGTAIGVLELASGDLPAGSGHAACCLELTDGKVRMVDISQNLVSKQFVFLETYRAAGNFWQLQQTDNPLGIHRRIQLWKQSGLRGAIYANLGLAYLKAGDHAQDISYQTKAIGLNPSFALAYYNRGNAYANSGQLPNALADYTRAIELDASCALAYYNRGAAYASSGQVRNAFSDYNKAIELNPKYVEAYFNRGAAYEKSGQLAKALADFSKAIELNPGFSLAYYNRGSAYTKSGQLANGLADFTKAIELNPTFAFAYYNRGVAYDESGQLAKAIADFAKAIELNPNFAVAYFSRGLASAHLGKMAEAKKDLQQAVELNPDLKERVEKVSEQFKLGL